MRHTPPRALYIALLFVASILFAVSGVSQTPDPQATPTPDPSASTAGAATDDNSTTAAAPTDPTQIDQLADTDSADVPEFLRGLIDIDDYLRLRNAHVRRLRGLMDPAFQPWRRNGAIWATQQRERQLQDAASTGSSDPNFVGPVNPNAGAPLIPASLLTPWTPLGPAPIPNGQTTAVTQAVSGRVTAIVVHPTN